MKKYKYLIHSNKIQMKRYILLLLMLICTAIVSQSAIAVPLLKYNLGENVTLLQSCNCTSVKIDSVVFIETGQFIIGNLTMVRSGNNFNVTIGSNNFTQLGLYKVVGSSPQMSDPFTYEIKIKNGGTFGFDFDNYIFLAIFVLVMIIVAILVWSNQEWFAGVILFVFGFVMILNGIVWYIATIFIILGVGVVERGYKKS